MINLIRECNANATNFLYEAHDIFNTQESSKSHVISLHITRKRINGLSFDQKELLNQAIICAEQGVYRAAHVMAWSAYIDLLETKLASDGFLKLHGLQPAWAKHKTIDDLRENIPEYQIIEVARKIELLRKPEMKSIQGLLAKRNECAHPSGYNPLYNETVGYIADILSRIESLLQRNI